jgi:predicted MFS family arabinose efflux permease
MNETPDVRTDPRAPTAPRTPGDADGRAFHRLIAATLGGFSGHALLLPIVPLWAVHGGGGAGAAGATTAVFMLTTVLAQLAMPWLLARGGYRWTLPAGCALLGLPTPLFLLTADAGALIAVSAVRGVGFGMATVAGAALAARLAPAARVGRATAAYGLAVGLPNVVFLSTGVWLALNAGFTAVFALATAAPLLGAAVAATVRAAEDPAPAEGHRADAAPPSGGAAAYAGLAAPFALILVAAVASSAVITFLALPLEAAPGTAAAALLGYGAASVATRWAAGALGDRTGRPALLAWGTAAGAAGMAVTAAGLWSAGEGWSGPGAAGAAAVVAGAVLFGAGFGAVQNDTIVVMFRRSGRGRYGTASAVWNIGIDAGTGAGAAALGAAVPLLGYGPAFALTGLAAALCLPAAVAVGRAARTG